MELEAEQRAAPRAKQMAAQRAAPRAKQMAAQRAALLIEQKAEHEGQEADGKEAGAG